MRPEDIDKLFKERLGPSSPTPPADLWNRLQEKMEAERPAAIEEERKPRSFMWLSYSIAAAIALLLSVGIVFYNVQRGTAPVDGLARNDQQVPEQPLIITEPAPEQAVAQAPAPAAAEADQPATPEVVAPAASETVSRGTIAKAKTKPAPARSAARTEVAKPVQVASAPATQLIANVQKPAIPEPEAEGNYYNTAATEPATFALASNTNLNAQPVEIIIKRAVAVTEEHEAEELTGFEKKQRLAKNIFKQVRNLSNGERVELSELGINADKIALETQIGKQKISKVINL